MKTIFFLTVLVLNANVFAANSGGGTVVGNGAGVVESNFQYAYFQLDKIIGNCVETDKCQLTAEEITTAKNITKITRRNENKKDKLVFLSEKLNPGFFTTGSSESNRIAKTYLNPDSPIFVNTDMLYEVDGRAAIKFPVVVRILIHELGHQLGLLDHGALDLLGSKISSFSEDHTNYYRFTIEEENKNIVFSVTNFETPVKSSMVIFNWKDESSQNLSATITASSKCANADEKLQGLEVLNGHFEVDNFNMLSFSGWVRVFCLDQQNNEVTTYKKDLNITLDSDYNISRVLVE